MATDLKNQRRGGFYWKGKDPYVSVTNALSIIDKPQLRYWFGREVFYALAQDPSLNEKDALAKPYQTSSKAADRGKTVHSVVETYKISGKRIETIPEAYKGYVTAFYKWVDATDIEIQEHERTVFSEKYGYAGTLDALAKNKKSGESVLIDVKTGKDIYPESFLQLAAYKQALDEEGVKVDSTAVLLLKEDGNYKWSEESADLEVFLAAKRLWEWRNVEIKEKLNGSK